ncbi:MAG: DUF4197 domain-containing protein [Bacteroidota bacterium]|nr:DUF4197 domain-containing protein [Bacteroidota bacterium]
MKKLLCVLFSTSLFLTSCEYMNKVATIANNSGILNTGTATGSLTQTDIIKGLKTALTIGTDSSVFKTSALNGYFKDQAIKILLPPEADVIVSSINSVPGGKKLLDNVILGINRSAEDAAKSAAPIFKNAITSMSITDGLAILKGQNPAASVKSQRFDSTAATGYLKTTTNAQLVQAFSVPINQSLDKKLVAGISTNKAWTNLTSAYNMVAPVLGKSKVTTNLGQYVTQRALDGLFLKVGEQELKIRHDPWKWASTTVGNILTRVFGK